MIKTVTVIEGAEVLLLTVVPGTALRLAERKRSEKLKWELMYFPTGDLESGSYTVYLGENRGLAIEMLNEFRRFLISDDQRSYKFDTRFIDPAYRESGTIEQEGE